jgi:hypothetical protein
MTQGARGPTTCSFCGSMARPIIYGLPSPDLFEKADQGSVELGGCVVEEGNPDWACTGPGRHRWTGDNPFALSKKGD